MKEQLKVIRWANDNYPPIDFNKNLRGILDLIREVRQLREEVQYLKKKIQGMRD